MKILLLLLLATPLCLFAQTTHKVAPKESLYSISRKYNLAPKDLAAYNQIDPNAGLQVGQTIRIPSGKKTEQATTPQPSVSSGVADPSPSGEAIYHKVKKKETLSSISQQYQKATVAQLKRWNQLTSDGIREGMNLIVGYSTTNEKTIAPVAARKQEPALAIEELPAERKEAIVIAEPPLQKPVSAEPKALPEEKKQLMVSGEGFFKETFLNGGLDAKGLKEETGNAGVFKSTSGWADGKFYCLHNTAPSGSIIKITHVQNQKSIYAKVLDVIPDLKQNAGLVLRMSNAAAAALGVSVDTFEVKLSY